MRAIHQQGKPLDAANWSMLDDDTGDTSVVPGGAWYDDQVDFSENNPDYRNGLARVRPSVVVKA